MIRIVDKKDCCGCTACASICPHDAILMQPDGMGFLYPVVDETKCVDCHLCEKVCAFNDRYDTSLNLLQPEVYGARHKDMHEIEQSRSGAVFVAVSDWVLEQGGIVYGAPAIQTIFGWCIKGPQTRRNAMSSGVANMCRAI